MSVTATPPHLAPLHRLALSLAVFGVFATAGISPRPAWAQECLQVPVGCTVSSAYGYRKDPTGGTSFSEFHNGVDFACPTGTPVVGSVGGVAEVSGFSQTAGFWVRQTTTSGYIIKYMHHQRNAVAVGDRISKGGVLAYTGNTGRSSGPHLHFQVDRGGGSLDPTGMFCGGSPPMAPGILNRVSPGMGTDADARLTRATPPEEHPPTPLGLEGSLEQILGDVIGSRVYNAEYTAQLATLPTTRLYAELSTLESISLRARLELTRRRQRIEALLAATLALRTQAMQAQIEAQRGAAAAARN